MAPETGELDDAMKGMRKSIDWLVYRRLNLKPDEEPVIQSLKAAIIRERPQ